MKRAFFGLSCVIIILSVTWLYYSKASVPFSSIYILPKPSTTNLMNISDVNTTTDLENLSYVTGTTNYTNSFGNITDTLLPLNNAIRHDSLDQTNSVNVMIVYGATKLWQGQPWAGLLDLQHCKYNNCISRNSSTFIGIEKADVVLFAVKLLNKIPVLPYHIRQRQYWVLMSYESSAYSFNRLTSKHNNQFNASMMYRKDSTIYYPWGKAIKEKTNLSQDVNFAEGKTKGAFSYLTNCGSMNYDRKGLMLALSRYAKVEIYSPGCKGVGIKRSPCPRLLKGSNPECELRVNRPYRFFLAFENSLCKEYVTEKFWDRLLSPGYFLPIVMGGLSVDDYTSIAPPDSFLHVNNFTSVKALGEYMKYLTENDEAYNKYHQWRYDYRITTSRGFGGCELCRLANERPPTPAIAHIDQWFNDPSRCRSYKVH